MGLQGGINLYRYGANNPVKNVDPLGLKIVCSSGMAEYSGLQETPCGTGGCTKADYQFEASPCREMKDCAGKWKFDGSVRLLVRVWFAQDPNAQYSPGKTLRQHEYEHVGDYLNACRAVQSAQSEGFSSQAECERARTGWLNWVRQVFSDFDQISGGRDK